MPTVPGKVYKALAGLSFEEGDLSVNNFHFGRIESENGTESMIKLVASALYRAGPKDPKVWASVELAGFNAHQDLIFAISSRPSFFGQIAPGKITEIEGAVYYRSPTKEPVPASKVCIRVTVLKEAKE